MTGRLICFVGPSGVGKDTVMEAYAAQSGAVLARRVITRPSAAGGEAFDGVTPEAFAKARAAGAFALSWEAHGLSYGVPAAIRDDLDAGRDVLANLSRTVLGTASARFPGTRIVQLTAPAEVLAARLAQRGRESAADIAARLRRRSLALPDGLDVITIDNGGSLQRTLQQLDAAFAPRKEPRHDA